MILTTVKLNQLIFISKIDILNIYTQLWSYGYLYSKGQPPFLNMLTGRPRRRYTGTGKCGNFSVFFVRSVERKAKSI